MNVNPASASYAQQYANNLQTTAQPTQQTEQNIQVQKAVPEEPSREARPVQEANESAVGRNVDVYI